MLIYKMNCCWIVTPKQLLLIYNYINPIYILLNLSYTILEKEVNKDKGIKLEI